MGALLRSRRRGNRARTRCQFAGDLAGGAPRGDAFAAGSDTAFFKVQQPAFSRTPRSCEAGDAHLGRAGGRPRSGKATVEPASRQPSVRRRPEFSRGPGRQVRLRAVGEHFARARTQKEWSMSFRAREFYDATPWLLRAQPSAKTALPGAGARLWVPHPDREQMPHAPHAPSTHSPAWCEGARVAAVSGSCPYPPILAPERRLALADRSVDDGGAGTLAPRVSSNPGIFLPCSLVIWLPESLPRGWTSGDRRRMRGLSSQDGVLASSPRTVLGSRRCPRSDLGLTSRS